MAGRAGVPPEEYAKFMPGTRFLTPEEALEALRARRTASTRCYGSGKVADDVQRREQGLRQAAAGRRRTSTARCRRRRSEGAPREAAATVAWSAEPMRELVAAARRSCRPARAAALLGGVVHRAARCSGARSATCRSSGTRWCEVTDPGDVDLDDAGHAGRAATRSPTENAERGGAAAAARRVGVPANPVFLPAPHEVAARAGHRRSPRRPRVPDEPWLHQSLLAQHPGDLLGLPAVVADRRAARHPVRRAARDRRG